MKTEITAKKKTVDHTLPIPEEHFSKDIKLNIEGEAEDIEELLQLLRKSDYNYE